MATVKPSFASAASMTCTIASLANAGQRESTAVDNTTNLYDDAFVQLTTKTGSSGTTTTGIVNLYAYASVDGGTTYGNSATGSDAGITLTSPPNLKLIGTVNAVANSTTYKSNPMSVAAAFGGVLPQKWGVVVENKTGGTMDSTGGNHLLQYQGVQYTVA